MPRIAARNELEHVISVKARSGLDQVVQVDEA
jgi:hypothetical protein